MKEALAESFDLSLISNPHNLLLRQLDAGVPTQAASLQRFAK